MCLPSEVVCLVLGQDLSESTRILEFHDFAFPVCTKLHFKYLLKLGNELTLTEIEELKPESFKDVTLACRTYLCSFVIFFPHMLFLEIIRSRILVPIF